MSDALRDYQRCGCGNVHAHRKAGKRAVCLVSPTGAGKTCMGEEIISSFRTVVWVAHRRELIQQTAARLRTRFGSSHVGIIMPGEYETPNARIQVATIQTLLARGPLPADCLVLDEAHHFAAALWREICERAKYKFTLGLTATPERQDGLPLGDIFDVMVVASSYSQLVHDRHLVPARVLRPKEDLGSDLAQDPIEAWIKHAEGSKGFAFFYRVDIAAEYAKKFRNAGVPAALIECNTPIRERDQLLSRFRRGDLRILTNVNTLTEGVDVPDARTIILGKNFGHVGPYLQTVGRALRTADNKPDAIVLDLTGATIRHGLPTDDREYSLNGRPISGGDGAARDGSNEERPEFTQTVRGVDLQMVARGALKRHEAPQHAPPPVPVDNRKRRAEFRRLVTTAKQYGMRAGFASAKYYEQFGEWPRPEWMTP